GVPTLHCPALDVAETLVAIGLERERGEQVLTHDAVFEFGRQTQHVDQRFTMLDDEGRFPSGLAPANRQSAGETHNQPASLAMRIASRRLRAPSFPIALDR